MSVENTLECPICFDTQQARNLVYCSCCFQKVCAVCDQILTQCSHCRTDLGALRIRFGRHSFDIHNSSILRLRQGNQTVASVIQLAKDHLPLTETQLTNPPFMQLLDSRGRWTLFNDDEKLVSANQYFLERIRLPHTPLSDFEIEAWIVALLISGKKLTAAPHTREEIRRKCNIYAARIHPSVLSQEQIDTRLASLTERGYCVLEADTKTYKYQA